MFFPNHLEIHALAKHAADKGKQKRLGNRSMVTIGLPPTSSKTLDTEVCSFGRAEYTYFASTPVIMGTFNPMLRDKRVPQPMKVRKVCNNSLSGL